MEPQTTSGQKTAVTNAGFAKRWREVHRAGQEIAAMAALSKEPLTGELERFPEEIEAIGGARWTLAQETLSDIDAMLRPGLCALRAIAARGQDTTAPALALWREFHASRSALMALTVSQPVAEVPVTAERITA